MPPLWIQGEISNFAAPGSGHWYFSLKDAGAQVRCAMFRQRALLLEVPAARRAAGAGAGARQPLRAARRVSAARSITSRKPAKASCAAQFELLKAKLQAEGLFAAERKRPLPALAATHRHHHLADRRSDPRHPQCPAAPLPGHPGADLPGAGAGRRRRARDRRRGSPRLDACRVRRADPRSRRRLARGPAGLQRRSARTRPGAVPHSDGYAASGTRSTSRSPISSPTCARQRPPARPSWWCPISSNGSHAGMQRCIASPAR